MTRLHPVTVLVLAELGLGAGCKRTDAHTAVQSAPEEPTPVAVAVVAPSATVPAPAVSAPPTPRACFVDKECPAGQRCMLPFDGAHTLPGPGQCWTGPMPGGRPLVVDGVVHVAMASPGSTWSAAKSLGVPAAQSAWAEGWADTLRRDAFSEHASISAFARTLCQLLALGAPAWLVEKTGAALQDEIRHAKDCFAWAARLGGQASSPGALPEAIAPIACSVHALARDVIRGGCIGETLAACTAHERAETAPLPALQALYRTLTTDEARHAALAYETVRWLATQDPTLAAVVHEERERFYAEASAEDVRRVAPMLALL